MERPARRPWTPLQKLFFAACLLPLLALTAYVGYFFAYLRYPELVSSHRAFYRACKSIEPGMPLAEARAAMAPFLEVGRTWHPPATLPAGLFQATTWIEETPAEHTSRLLFIPDERNIADWCLVHPDGEAVKRVEVVPD